VLKRKKINVWLMGFWPAWRDWWCCCYCRKSKRRRCRRRI